MLYAYYHIDRKCKEKELSMSEKVKREMEALVKAVNLGSEYLSVIHFPEWKTICKNSPKYSLFTMDHFNYCVLGMLYPKARSYEEQLQLVFPNPGNVSIFNLGKAYGFNLPDEIINPLDMEKWSFYIKMSNDLWLEKIG